MAVSDRGTPQWEAKAIGEEQLVIAEMMLRRLATNTARMHDTIVRIREGSDDPLPNEDLVRDAASASTALAILNQLKASGLI